MNDIILSSLIHLFVLFGAKHGMDKDKSIELISAYLTRFFGIRNLKSYIRLYNDLRDFYDDAPDMDKDMVVENICGKVSEKMRPEEKLTQLLRLMEFSSQEGCEFKSDEAIFCKVRDLFGINEAQYEDMVAFIQGRACQNVLVIDLDGDCGTLKTLRFTQVNLLAVTYEGTHSLWMDDIKMLPGVFQIWQQSSLIKSSHFSPIYYSTIISKYDGVKEEDMELCGRDINFRFKQGGDNGMHNLSFNLHSGQLVAIMGGSGVGKSTLLSLLNGTLHPQEGSITINGHSIDEPQAKKLIGFVPQDDLLIEELTVYQNLWFTAKLCFADMSEEDLDARVMKVLRELGLDAAKDLKVGSPINKYISGGQRKRLNIALELIREPAVLFLDEPTSGLSSSDTEKVVYILKELAIKGKLIIVNIHQPSSDVFKLFDRLWLLDKGGYPIFDGNPIESISYFKGLANFADPRTSACPTCGNVNPEIVLEIIDDKLFDNTGKLTDQRKVSPQEWHDQYLKHREVMADPEYKDVPRSDQKRPGKLKQMLIFLQRNVKSKITNLQYMLVTLLEAPLLALICAFLTRYTPTGSEYTLMDNKNFPTYMFMAIIVAIFLGMSGSAEEIIRDRAILKREKFLNLSAGSYLWSKMIYMAAVCLVQTGLFLLVGNAIIGVTGMNLIWWAVLFVSAFLSSLIGLLLSQCMNSVVAIYITIPILLIPQILLCGLVVDFEDLNPDSDTGNVPIIGDVIPSRWAYEALAVASFTQNDYASMTYLYDKRRFEAMYYNQVFGKELEAANETRRADSIAGKEPRPDLLSLLQTEMPQLSKVSGMEPYAGNWSYEDVDTYVQKARKMLKVHSNNLTLELDARCRKCIKEIGKDEFIRLKESNCNTRLQDLLINADAEKPCVVVGSRIVPRSGYVYLTPRSRNGRAQFYSGEKVLGKYFIPTLQYNIGVMVLMCFVLMILLLTDVPGKFIRKEIL